MGNTLWSSNINSGFMDQLMLTQRIHLFLLRSNMLLLMSLDKIKKKCTTLNGRYYNMYSCVMKTGGICYNKVMCYSSLYIGLLCSLTHTQLTDNVL